MLCSSVIFFCFKQKTAYEMRISDWSSDVCSSDLDGGGSQLHPFIRGLLDKLPEPETEWAMHGTAGRIKWLQTAANIFDMIYTREDEDEIGRASGRERVCQYV